MCQQQIRHVRARHQQQKSYRAEQDQQRGANIAGDRVLQRENNSIFEEIIVLLARGIVNAPGYRTDILIRLLDRHTVAETPDCIIVVRRPASVFSVHVGWQPQIDLRRETKTGREYSDNGADRAINLQVRLREVRRRPEVLFPVSIAGKNGAASAFFRVVGGEVPSEDRLNTENFEKVGRDVCNHRARRL